MASFLDKLKEKNAGASAAPVDKPATTVAASAAAPLKPKSPLGAPKSPLGAPKAETPAAEAKKPPFLGSKPAGQNPFGKPKLPAGTVPIPPIEEEEAAVKPEAAPEVVEEVVTPETEVVTEETEAAEEAAPEQESAPENIVAAIQEEDGKAAPEPATGKGGNKSRSKNQNKKPAPKEEPEAQSQVPVDGPTEPAVSYAEAFRLIQSPYVDPEWDEFKAAIEESIDAIVISDDMNAGTMKSTIADLSVLRQQIWSPLQSTKTMYEQLSSKEPEGLIERIKKTNLGTGSNDLQRKKAGIEACINYVDPRSGTPLNLYEVLEETRIRYNLLKGVMDSINYKTNILITMSGALKLEKNHLAGDPA